MSENASEPSVVFAQLATQIIKLYWKHVGCVSSHVLTGESQKESFVYNGML